MAENAFEIYISEINKSYTRGIATEHTHRPALKNLIESINNKITAVNEPKRIACGAPDLLITLKKRIIEQTIGYIECKDIGINLKDAERSEQIKDRYLPSLENLILTDYIEFRLYINGEKQLTARLAEEIGGKFRITSDGIEKLSQLLNIFLSHEPLKITSAKDLTVKMGDIAKLLRDIINNAFAQEQKTGTLHSQYEAFKEVLIHDLTEVQFADMYSQTICYGLFSARCHMDDVILFGIDKHAVFHGLDEKRRQFTREAAAYLLPKTNPFLRKTFGHIAGSELDDRIAWLVDELVTLLRNSDMSSVLRDFAKKTKRRDPVFHFYETFLAEYDKRLKKSRGVYYTPDEVVSYIVRSVDILLKEKFGLQRGLVDNSKVTVEVGDKEKTKKEVHKCLILDPAVGTGTFLYEIIEQIYNKFKRQKGSWSGYVKEHLLPRIFGFELMMAPYSICHMKLGLQLAETGYDFESDERLGVYLTNTLEEAEEISKSFWAQWISEEARAANKIKKDLPIMVVLGNPPYKGISANKSWEIVAGKKTPNLIGRLLKDYYQVDGQTLEEKNPKWLQDDYVKFIRFAQYRIEQTGRGILAFITNHGYLDNPTFRGMRQSLIQAFDEIYLLDLHGNQKKKETCPDGSKDVNVFDIKQGVSIGVFVKKNPNKTSAKIYHYEIFGQRKYKYNWLETEDIKTTNWIELKTTSPFYLFVPQNIKYLNQYNTYWKITDIIHLNGVGLTTSHDNLVIDFEEAPLLERAKYFKETTDSNKEICDKLKISMKKGWNIDKARILLNEEKDLIHFIKILSYRPFDNRLIYYHDSLVWRTVKKVMQHMLLGKNIGLITARSNKSSNMDHFFCTRFMMETKCGESTTQSCLFPLYLYPTEKHQNDFDLENWPKGKDGRIPNLDKEFIEELSKKIYLNFVSDGCGDLKKDFGPEDVLSYIYGIFHSPEYRKRYAQFLKIDFPRVPMPTNKEMFVKVCKIGQELIKLHLLEAKIIEDDKQWPRFDVKGSGLVEKGYPKYIRKNGEKGKVYINQEQYFEGIEPDIWEFFIGGYQVCEKWLKDRRERTLSYDDINHYQKIVVAFGETIRLMKEIDEVITSNGGWPM
jgi:predicted helicase